MGRRRAHDILGDPGADNGGKGKSKRAGKYGTKKSKERREEPLGTMSYQTSSKRSPPFWLLIGARKLLCFFAQSEARMAATVGSGLVRHCPKGLFSPFFTFLRAIFSWQFRIPLALTICPWVSEDGSTIKLCPFSEVALTRVLFFTISFVLMMMNI